MKKILVTGCNGQLGKAINQEYTKDEAEFINTDVQAGEGVTALDITDVEQVLALVRETKPDVIINCAAHTAVDLCEQQWDSAYKINALGARNLSIAASEICKDKKLVSHGGRYHTIHCKIHILCWYSLPHYYSQTYSSQNRQPPCHSHNNSPQPLQTNQ